MSLPEMMSPTRDEIAARIEALKADYDNLDVDLDDLDEATTNAGPWNRARGWYEALTWVKSKIGQESK